MNQNNTSSANTSNEENTIIRINNEVAHEKLLLPLRDVNLLTFQCLTLCFGAALLIQVVSVIPVGYKLQDYFLTLVLFMFGAFVVFLMLNKKVPTLKFYMLVASLLLGLIIGL